MLCFVHHVIPTPSSNHISMVAHLHPYRKHLIMITNQRQEHSPSLNRSLGQLWLGLSLTDLGVIWKKSLTDFSKHWASVVCQNRSLWDVLLLHHFIFTVHLQSNNVMAKINQVPHPHSLSLSLSISLSTQFTVRSP